MKRVDCASLLDPLSRSRWLSGGAGLGGRGFAGALTVGALALGRYGLGWLGVFGRGTEDWNHPDFRGCLAQQEGL